MKNQGTVVVSIDYEYAWGYRDHSLSEDDLARIRKEVAITKDLLELFDEYSVPATWAIVGHLLMPHEEYGRDSAWFDDEGLIDDIRDADAGHEIASHSYEHVLYSNASEDAVREDIARAKEVHEKHGLPFASFVFPRNKEGKHALVKEAGIKCFRKNTEKWYMRLPGTLERLGHFCDYFLVRSCTQKPYRHPSGLIVIPDSVLLFSRKGVRALIPQGLILQKVKQGIRQAIERNEVFHLWFHPSNFSYDTSKQLLLLRAILKYIHQMENVGKIKVKTMGDIAQQYGE